MAMIPEHSIHIAIVGAGRMAREHIRAFVDVPGIVVAGIFSRTMSRAEALAAEFGIPVVAPSLPELYERTQARLAVVTVSAESMSAVACQCLRLGWDLMLEKPVGYNLADAETIVTAARESSARVWVGLNRRFLSSTRAALDDLGRRPGPRHIQVLDQIDANYTASFGHPPEVMANLMYFSSIHLIDYFRVFGRGEIRAVYPIVPWDSAKPWLAATALEFTSGDTGLYQAMWNAPGPWAVAVNTREVRWEMKPLERANFQRMGTRLPVESESSVFDQKFKPGFRLQAEQVVKAALGIPSEAPTLEEAIATMRLIGRIYGLSQDGGATLDRQQQVIDSDELGRLPRQLA